MKRKRTKNIQTHKRQNTLQTQNLAFFIGDSYYRKLLKQKKRKKKEKKKKRKNRREKERKKEKKRKRKKRRKNEKKSKKKEEEKKEEKKTKTYKRDSYYRELTVLIIGTKKKTKLMLDSYIYNFEMK